MKNAATLLASFSNTLNMINSNPFLTYETKKAMHSSRVYKEDFTSNTVSPCFENTTVDVVFVVSGTTFATAKGFCKFGRVAVLNFANPENPGGGVQNGAMAQEECLCRSSNLYPCLCDKRVFDEFYLYHRNLRSFFYSDRLIYTKGVTVFKDDSDVPQLMPENEWFQVDVITCSAPYIARRKYTNQAALKELFKSRIKNIFEAAVDNGAEVLVLGAFGCGAFKNPPEIVAKAFHEVIEENAYHTKFKRIVFAIKSTVGDDPYMACPNITAFEEEFYGLSAEGNKRRFSDPYSLEQAFGAIAMPSGRILKGGKEFNPYLEWKAHNPYFGKQFSVLGDSISTLDGYNPLGYNLFYFGENCFRSGVREMKDTWWGKVIDFFGGELLVNNSWSGSRVTQLPGSDSLFPSGCSDERTGNLHIRNVVPDVIIVYLGTNDWANGVPIEFDGCTLLGHEYNDIFVSAYGNMIRKLRSNYPNAEIWCCTLCATFMSSDPSFHFPYKYNGNYINKYNQIIETVANQQNCKLIDLFSYNVPYDSIDGSHPNADGMNTLATLMIRSIGGKDVEPFLDCKNDQHDYKCIAQNADSKKYVCQKCGRIEYEPINSKLFCSKCRSLVSIRNKFCSKCGIVLSVDICPNCNRKTLKHTLYADYCTSCNVEVTNISPFIWNDSIMKTKDITDFSLSFGSCPNINISFDGKKLIYCNRINPRDVPHTTCSVGFFDDKIVNLTDKQQGDIRDYIKKIDFRSWRTEKQILENYEMGACGFFIDNSFTCIFKNGVCFKCYGPNFKAFDKLCIFIKNFCKKEWWQLDKPAGIEVKCKPQYDLDAEYVCLPVGRTGMLYEDIIKLFDPDANQNIEIRKTRLDVGRNPDCDLFLDNSGISRIHASFYYEINKWFIMDKDSTNGTWLNNKKLEHNKKYQLTEDDIINFAGIKNYIFYKSDFYETTIPNTECFDSSDFQESVPLGTVIGEKYELVRQIGDSGFYKLFFAIAKPINRTCAVKICLNKNESSFSNRDILIHDANMIKELNHPVIPKIIDVIENAEYLAVVQEFFEGETLETIVENRGTQSVGQVVNWSKQLCGFLQYLHSLNPPYIYRDMKPANIILQPSGYIKIIDFGIMRTYKPGKMKDTVALGTRGYAAPEQYGTAQADPRTDIFGLGVTMYFLLTGDDPRNPNFNGMKPIRALNPSIPKGMEYIIEKCTRIDPNQRYQSAGELLKDLENIRKLPQKHGILKNLFR